MHIEEDAGKNTHGTNGYSYVDLNRQGVPLLEVVSEPDMEDPEEAYAYLTKLRQIVQFTGASDVKMEEGSMRVDTNISIRPAGQKELGNKVEMKNLNSFDHVRRSLSYAEAFTVFLNNTQSYWLIIYCHTLYHYFSSIWSDTL